MEKINSKRKVFIIDPSYIVVAGLQSILAESTKLIVCETSTDIYKAIDRLIIVKPDIVLVNPLFLDLNRKLYSKGLYEDALYCSIGYSSNPFYCGNFEMSDTPSKILRILESLRNTTESVEQTLKGEELSQREKEILVAVAKGLHNKEIASIFNISIHTVISHRKNISKKTGIKSVSGFVVYALLNNLIDESEIHD